MLLPADKARYVGEAGRDGGGGDAQARRWTQPKPCTVEYEELPYLVETEKALRPGNAPRSGTRLPDNVLVDTEFGDAKAKTDQAFAKAAHVVQVLLQHRTRDRA